MLKKIILLIVVIGLGVGLFFGVKFFLNRQKQQGKAGLQVKSEPAASVFLDSRFLGRTPFDDRIEPGEYTLKLIPESTATTAASWQGKVVLRPNILTFVNRELGTSDLTSSGEIISLERLSGKETEISIVTIPEGAAVKIDGEDKGVAPLLLRNIEPGEHEVVVFSAGFASKSVKVKTISGFKLVLNIQLAVTGEGKETEKESTSVSEEMKTSDEKTLAKPYVEILDTPTGWLRVRSEPSTSASEAGRVKPQEKYPLLDEKAGWYKIKTDSVEGWISGSYAKKYE